MVKFFWSVTWYCMGVARATEMGELLKLFHESAGVALARSASDILSYYLHAVLSFCYSGL
jgi:hypothetical protein